MPDINLENVGLFTGIYGDTTLELEVPTTKVTTILIAGITATKSADKDVWLDGALTYTIEIENDSDQDFILPKFTDILDTTYITLVDDSVEVDGIPAAYTYVSGLLTVDLATIAKGETVIITFQVQKI